MNVKRTILRSSRVVVPSLARGSGAPWVVQPADITIEAGVITAVNPPESTLSPDAVVDLGDDLITPGFVDAHTHLSMTSLRGLPSSASMRGNVVEELFYTFEGALQPGDVRAFTRMGALECLMHGTTTVWDHYYYGQEVAEALAEVGLSGVVAPTLQDLHGPGVARREAEIRATVDIAESAEMSQRGIVAALGPHATDTVSNDILRHASQALPAHVGAVPVHIHVAQSASEYALSVERFGKSPVERLLDLGFGGTDRPLHVVHGLWVSDSDRARLAKANASLGFCPASQMQFAFPAPVGRWLDEGIPVALGTDAAASNDGWSVQAEMRLAASSTAWSATYSEAEAAFAAAPSMPNAEALEKARHRAATTREPIGRAETLLEMVWGATGEVHPGLRVGAIEVGRRAMISVWDAKHPCLWPTATPLRALAYSSTAPALKGVMVCGEWRLDPKSGGWAHRDAWGAWVDEAEQRLAALLSRL